MRYAAILLTLTAAATANAAGTLYDASLGSLPTAQSWQYQANPNNGPATQSIVGPALVLDTLADRADRAGYPSRLPTVIPGFPFPNHPLIGSLDRTAGFHIAIDLRIDAESHAVRDDNGDGLDDRAGFSVLAICTDLRAIELAFFADRVFAQDDDLDGAAELFTQAESVLIDTTVARRYTLSVDGDIYRLFADDAPMLGGRLRDYTALGGNGGLVYKTQDLIFWGDNTSSAEARAEVELVTLTDGAAPGPACAGDVNGDGATDVFDFATLAANFGQAVPLGTLGDLDLNGVVDVFDFGTLAADFGCGAP